MKGADFERTICKRLSLWWTYGDRDDVFWRSSQSGGRATIRHRKGKRTAGSYGDITALDPIGEPLTQLFTIELKRGRSHGEPGDLLDCSGSLNCHAFIKALRQARTAHETADSRSWLLISRRDRRQPVVFFPSWLISERGPLFHARPGFLSPPVFRFLLEEEDFIGTVLEKFLKFADPLELAKVAGA
jgi:hypothetical protein